MCYNNYSKGEVKMKIYKLDWTKIDWSAYHTIGYNYVKDSGTIYATTKEKALKECPITAEQGKIEIAEILVID
jgi:hypothetical protein